MESLEELATRVARETVEELSAKGSVGAMLAGHPAYLRERDAARAYEEAAHPRGTHGHWIAKFSGQVHGQSIPDATVSGPFHGDVAEKLHRHISMVTGKHNHYVDVNLPEGAHGHGTAEIFTRKPFREEKRHATVKLVHMGTSEGPLVDPNYDAYEDRP